MILIARPDTTITYQTPSTTRILGYEPGSLEGQRFTTFVHSDDVEQALALHSGVAFRAGMSITGQWRVRHRDGSWRHVEVVANNLLSDPTVAGIVLTIRDVSERKGLEDELKHQAFHDGLSGLANRAPFPRPARARVRRGQLDPTPHWPFCSWTSTTSSLSTTPSGTLQVTTSWSRLPNV